MATDKSQAGDYAKPLRRLFLGIVIFFLISLFLIWRIDNPRVERVRSQVVDSIVPQFDWALKPITGLIDIVQDFRSYQQIYEQNQELRRDLQQMKAWKEAALQLEQENARLLDLNNVQVDPKLTYVTGKVMADSGSPFRQSVLINIGAGDGILEGWAAMDGLGLVGRIVGVGRRTARVMLLTDTSSSVAASILPSGQRVIVSGDNSLAPPIEFLENPDLVKPGDRIVTSGDEGVLPPDLLIGQVAQDPRGRLRVRIAADYERLEFVRILRAYRAQKIEGTGQLIIGGAIPKGPLKKAQSERPDDG